MLRPPADDGTVIRVKDVGEVTLGPDLRRGVTDLDGQGEVVSGIVVMRSGENALDVIGASRQSCDEIEPGLPPGVKIVPIIRPLGAHSNAPSAT